MLYELIVVGARIKQRGVFQPLHKILRSVKINSKCEVGNIFTVVYVILAQLAFCLPLGGAICLFVRCCCLAVGLTYLDALETLTKTVCGAF